MIFDHFYHGTLRKYVIVFGSLFDDLSVVRLNTDGSEVQRILVPIAYGPKEKFLARLAQDPTLENPVGIVLPRIGFEITNIVYDATRKLNSMNRRLTPVIGNTHAANHQFVEVPYTLTFGLYVMARNTEDGTQILEQILPYFTPAYTVTIKTIPALGLRADVPVVLESVGLEDTYEGDMVTRRAMVWHLTFQMKAMVYGPLRQKKVITDAIVDSYTIRQQDSIAPASYLRTEQGDRIVLEDASGLILIEEDDSVAGVARVSRTRVQPNPLNAQVGDAFGFTTVYEDFVDGKARNTVTGEDEDV